MLTKKREIKVDYQLSIQGSAKMIKSRVKIKHFSMVGLVSPGWVRNQVRTHSDFCWTRGLGLWPTGLGLRLGLWSSGFGLTPDGPGLWPDGLGLGLWSNWLRLGLGLWSSGLGLTPDGPGLWPDGLGLWPCGLGLTAGLTPTLIKAELFIKYLKDLHWTTSISS